MRIRVGAVCTLLLATLLAAAARADAATPMIITGAAVSPDNSTLVVSGVGFSGIKTVTLGGVLLGGVTVDATATTLTLMPAFVSRRTRQSSTCR